jgi:hypothetical protein
MRGLFSIGGDKYNATALMGAVVLVQAELEAADLRAASALVAAKDWFFVELVPWDSNDVHIHIG